MSLLDRTATGTARCEGEACLADGSLTYRGDAVDPASGRRFFVDAPSDLEPGEPVTLVLNLHGGGSLGNWQRHYFPLVDLKDRLRLVVISPTAATMVPFVEGGPPVRVWVPDADDAHLEAIVRAVVDELGPAGIRAFWLAGHSQGGMTSFRLLGTPFFAERVDGFVSLSGGRYGAAPFVEGFGPPLPDGSPPPARAARFGEPRLPSSDISFVFAVGEREIGGTERLPASSPLADRLGCGPRRAEADIVDDEPGHIWDFGRCTYPVWGLPAGPGTARVWRYPDGSDGRVVADIVRLAKGHTEGLEPRVTEAIATLMVQAPGGRIAAGA